jgi:carboxylesterase
MTNAYLHNPNLPWEPFNLESSGPNAVLLFHGFTATCQEVARLGKVLNRAGFATRGPLLPGHGSNPAELNKVRWQDWTDAAESAYQELARRYQRVFVGGESNGGLVALYLASVHPEIAGVMAYAPALKLPITRWQRWQLYLIAPFIAGIPKDDLADNTTWQGYKVNPPKALIQLLRLQGEVKARLPKIRQPIMVVQGRKDHTIDPRSGEIVYEQVRSKVKRFHWMEKSGHCVLLDEEQPEVTRLTMDFLYEVMALKS